MIYVNRTVYSYIEIDIDGDLNDPDFNAQLDEIVDKLDENAWVFVDQDIDYNYTERL